MTQRTANTLLAWLVEQHEEMTALVRGLVLAESPSLDREALLRPLEILDSELDSLGFVVRRIGEGQFGDHVYARPSRRYRHAGHQLLVGHLDTVWPRGSIEDMPLRTEDDELYGPGVFDMKGGLVEIVFALRALAATGLVPEVTPVVFINSDEEVGSPSSRRHLARLARGAVRALVLEGAAGTQGKLKTARKGAGSFTLTVHGRAAHAGSSPEEGVSAILELAEQIKALNALNDPVRGLTVNVGTVDGGLRPNVVAPVATAEIGVRAPTTEAATQLESSIRALRATRAGAHVEVSGGFGRPPMPCSLRSRALFERARELGALLGLDLQDAGVVGGSSDANLTSPYAPTLDGLGPVGNGAHALDERIVVSSLAERAALLALLVLEPASRPAGRRRPRRRRTASRRVFLLGSPVNETNRLLLAAWPRVGLDVALVPPRAARSLLEPGDAVMGRIDVLRTLDGVEPGLLELLLLERSGFTVLNRASSLLACHDKWRTARALDHAGLPQPRTMLLHRGGRCAVEPPLVVKPRFGSWGQDVMRCLTRTDVELCLVRAAAKPWFRRHGALIQELVPSAGVDLRIVVAGGQVVGAIERVACAGDWRTNTSLGGSRRPVDPPEDACALALAAAAAVDADLVGVDLLPLADGYSVIELNGAVDFTPEYGLRGRDAYEAAAAALGLGSSQPNALSRESISANPTSSATEAGRS